jgi:FkbM family methyltransferase
MFSGAYLIGSARLVLKYPSLILAFVSGKNVALALQSKKMDEWSRVRNSFSDRPKKTLEFEIYLNPNDMSKVSPSIATVGWINLAREIVIIKFLKKGMTFLDVGANIGFYSLLAAKIVGDSGMVISFEPEKENLAFLRKSIISNNFQKIETREQVLSDKQGMVNLYLAPQANPEAHSLVVVHGGGSKKVESTTLPAVADSLTKEARKIDFIKMHVGCENLILSVANETIQNHKPIILMSFIPSQWVNDQRLFEELNELYIVYQVVDSPFLIRTVTAQQVFAGPNTELLLLPKQKKY